MSKPNIIWVHTDSHDGRMMGCMGHPALTNATPNMDRLAAQGAMFQNFYSNNPICCPSRSSMLSGTYTYQCEAWNNYRGLADDDPNLHTHLDTHGYRQAIYGKTDYQRGRHTTRARVTAWTRSAGIQRPSYLDPRPRVIEDDRVRVAEGDWKNIDRGIAYLKGEAAESGEPFMLYLGLNQPHPAFVASRRYMDLIDADAIDIPEQDNDQDHPVMAYNRFCKNWQHGLYPEMVKLTRHIYLAMIAEVDAMLGKLLAAVDELGLWENTYIVFSSDHGEMALEHNNWYKMAMYEGSIRVPFIAVGPDIVPGTVVENLASLTDVYPTFMDMTGLPAPEEGLMGQSLLPEMRGESSTRQDWVLSEYHDTTAMTGMIMLRTGDWKYIAFPGYEPMLFDMVGDPDELHSLAAERPEVVAELDAKLRGIVDYEAVDAKVKAYDKRSFRQWRMERRSVGDYETEMAKIYSGFDRLEEGDWAPWTEENEQQVLEWLNSD